MMKYKGIFLASMLLHGLMYTVHEDNIITQIRMYHPIVLMLSNQISIIHSVYRCPLSSDVLTIHGVIRCVLSTGVLIIYGVFNVRIIRSTNCREIRKK